MKTIIRAKTGELDPYERMVRTLATSLPMIDLGSTQAIQAITDVLREAVAAERDAEIARLLDVLECAWAFVRDEYQVRADSYCSKDEDGDPDLSTLDDEGRLVVGNASLCLTRIEAALLSAGRLPIESVFATPATPENPA